MGDPTAEAGHLQFARDVTYAGRGTQVMIGTGFSCSVGTVHLWMLNVSHIFLLSITWYSVLRAGLNNPV